MDYGFRTMRNFNTVVAGLTVKELLGPNPYRFALLFSPVANQLLTGAPIAAAVFAAGANQKWTVPNGVTAVIDSYAWGSGGNAGASGALLGGGGGGGGGWARSGPETVVGGQTWSVSVDAGGLGGQSTIIDASNNNLVIATSGATGVLDIGGAGGVGSTGATGSTGGAGAAATALAGTGAGGGGGAGNPTNGGAGAAAVGGAGGGAATISGYGQGGAGGNGSLTGVAGLSGVIPGGGGGGGGKTGGGVGVGADGLAVIFYEPAGTGLAISIDQDPNLVLLQGAFNFLPGRPYPIKLNIDDIGSAIMEPWYVISGLANQIVRVTEYSYVPERR